MPKIMRFLTCEQKRKKSAKKGTWGRCWAALLYVPTEQPPIPRVGQQLPAAARKLQAQHLYCAPGQYAVAEDTDATSAVLLD